MKRSGIFRPTIEDLVEISGIETLHPGGIALTKRTGEVAGMEPGIKVLDVSCGRGTHAIYYVQTFGVTVTGVDLSGVMLATALANVSAAGVSDKVRLLQEDSQKMSLADDSFDVVINECAVGIPDDSQAVLNEMVRVTKPGGRIAIHESTWRASLSQDEKDDLSERYGTTPMELEEWVAMLERAGVTDLGWEFDEWSSPEMFWKIRKDRDVKGPDDVFTLRERIRIAWRIFDMFGLKGLHTLSQNKKIFRDAILGGKIGYCLFWGRKP